MYLDSCIIVKLLVVESDSDFYQEALVGERLSSSELATTEVWSTLLSKERDREITAEQRMEAWQLFNRRVRDKELLLHPLDSSTLQKANRIMEACHPRVPLRTLDALHCAACDLKQDFPICSTDRRIRQAAVALGFPLFPDGA